MKNFEKSLMNENLNQDDKSNQISENTIENEKQIRAKQMELILKQIHPIKSVFNSDEEIKKILLVPKEERQEAIFIFKDKLIRQREAWALCRSAIEEQIELSHDVPREKMINIIKDFAFYYGFTTEHIKIAESLIDDYLEIRERIKEVRKEYSDKISLINRLTGINFTKADEEDFIITVGPMSIEILCSGFNAGRIYEKSEKPVADFRFFGFAATTNELNPVYYIIINKDFVKDSNSYAETVLHEREHQKNRILSQKLYNRKEASTDIKKKLNQGIFNALKKLVDKKFYKIEKSIESELFEKYITTKNLEEKVFFLEEYMRLMREHALNRVKNEIIARGAESNYTVEKDCLSLFKPGGNYDFLIQTRNRGKKEKDLLWEETAKKILEDEYLDIINKAIIAFNKLIRYRFSNKISSLLSDKRLTDWPKTVKRLLE